MVAVSYPSYRKVSDVWYARRVPARKRHRARNIFVNTHPTSTPTLWPRRRIVRIIIDPPPIRNARRDLLIVLRILGASARTYVYIYIYIYFVCQNRRVRA